MLNQAMQDALNDQINAEFASGYLYLSMSAYFESLNMHGMAGWMRVQAGEEYKHGMKFFEFINQRGGRVMLRAIEGVPAEWNSPLAVFEATYKHEQNVTARIHRLVEQSVAAKDHATTAMLQWFVNEQVEEEASALDVVNKLKLVADSKGGLYMLDHELGKRGE